MKKIPFIFILLVSTILVFAQKSNTKVELQLTLRDGNLVKGTSKITEIVLNTDYGKLQMPIASVSSVEFGIIENPQLKDKIISLVKNLTDPSEEVRLKYYQEIMAMGVAAIPTLKSIVYADKYEPSVYSDYSADAALKELSIINGVSESGNEKDVVFIDFAYSMGGICNIQTIPLTTEYGLLTIPREKIKKMDITVFEEGNESTKSFVLSASKHISGNTAGGWLKTGIMIKPGQRIEINASGEVYLASLAASYKPDGTYNTSTYNYDGGEVSNNANSYPTYGCVVYKIGDAGTAIKAGSKYSGNATAGGMLYLSIYETVYNASNTGSYSIKIKVK